MIGRLRAFKLGKLGRAHSRLVEGIRRRCNDEDHTLVASALSSIRMVRAKESAAIMHKGIQDLPGAAR